MDTASLDIFTLIVSNFRDIFYSGLTAVKPYSLGLLSVLICLDGTLFFIMAMFRSGGLMEGIVSKLLTYGSYIYIISDFSDLIKITLKGFFFIGSVAGGNAIDDTFLTTPSELVRRGWEVCIPTLNQLTGAGEEGANSALDKASSGLSFLYDAINGIAIHVILSYLLLFIIVIFCMLCFAILALQITLTLCEFYICGLVAYVLIPFGVFKPFAFMAEKAFGSIVMFGTKLMCLAIVLGIVEIIFKPYSSGKVLTLQESLGLAIMALALAFITWVVPAVVSSAAGGTPSLSSGSVVGSAISSVTTAYTSMQMAKNLFNGGGSSGGSNNATAASSSPLRPTGNDRLHLV